ncbi:MAG: glycoside hydrolase family 2 [Candidatus Omnitrophota bacterium]|jgi:hypothetical protein|nr:MAG: glycoside hydrolase family 2 [Candidatus Omnitrophota bacterium]
MLSVSILFRSVFTVSLVFFICGDTTLSAEEIPLPEHPRPDFQREQWVNLNGPWDFQFDKENVGIKEKWFADAADFAETILVPFPWGSKLSQVEDQADIGWYARPIEIPASWQGKRVFLVIGASDWETTAWLDGHELGSHQGGYIPFEFELTPHVQFGQSQKLVIRVDDARREFTLFGKQGYGNARGIWQTPYLEARGQISIDSIYFTPDIDAKKALVKANLSEAAPTDMQLRLHFKSGNLSKPELVQNIAEGSSKVEFEVSIPHPRLWDLDDPFLYEVSVSLSEVYNIKDRVDTYFGMRKISVLDLPGTDYPYIALNNKPIYLQMTLDQAYHPDGFYTFPSDEFTRDEILRSRKIGLNAMRVHVKVPLTRKLFWADRLGMLIMQDIPNSWGEPDADMRREIETTLRAMFRRDYNHPATFSWVLFNETWGLKGGKDKKYTPETQQWVASMYHLAKELDPMRIVEDNSPCLYDHVITDLNSWHAYLPGYQWREFLGDAVAKTFAGSTWNFVEGYTQSNQPMMNSECGNVWGYEGSTGDVDWSWDYHIMMNEFRRHPKICGWLYTEHHDVINEWNGYYRFDRSEKFTGMSDLAPGMDLRDLHSSFYLALGNELCQTVKPGASIQLPVYASFLADRPGSQPLRLCWELVGWDSLGRYESFAQASREIPYKPWMCEELPALEITAPPKSALAVLRVQLVDEAGTILHRNFTTFLVAEETAPRRETISEKDQSLQIVRIEPQQFTKAEWSLKQWNVLDGLKVNGAGSGFFEYHIPLPTDLNVNDVAEAVFKVEVSAKQLFGKDREGMQKVSGDFMLGKGTHDPSLNPNSYPMTDTVPYPSAVRIRVNGEVIGLFELPDDPADHRGILSWHSQKRDRRLREAGSYGYLISAAIPSAVMQKNKEEKDLVIRLEVDEALPGGLAIYGERFGRYPLDPTIVFVMKK